MRSRFVAGLVLLVGVAGLAALFLFGPGLRSRPDGPRSEPTLRVADALGGAGFGEDYARATEPRLFSFPEDHGPHPRFRTEWWYVTGHLEAGASASGGTPGEEPSERDPSGRIPLEEGLEGRGPSETDPAEDGRRFGFQFTLFRVALAPDPPASPSAWATNQVYMGHFALTDVEGRRFVAFERFARGAADLAGARAAPLRVWLEDWSLEGSDTGAGGTGSGEGRATSAARARFPLRVSAREGDVGIELTLGEGKGIVLQGDGGLSRKGTEPGNASYYYSFPRMPAAGTVDLEGERFRVTGTAWLDREWSTSVLEEEQVGWDWFSLQLDDGREVMYYRLRRRDGSADPHSSGVVVGPAGGAAPLEPSDVILEELGTWTSPLDGTVYPSGWRLTIPNRGVDLQIRPVLEDQELDLTVRYWEGAVDVSGRTGDRTVGGRGYVELTGYADVPAARTPGGVGRIPHRAEPD